MFYRMLSPTARIIFTCLFVVGNGALAYLLYTDSPLVAWLHDLQRLILSTKREGKVFFNTLLVGLFPVALVALAPAVLYDLFTRQGKFER